MVETVQDSFSFYVIFIVIGFMGLSANLLVTLTPILFKRLRTRMFLRILAIMSFCDACVSIAYLLNLGRNFDQSSSNSPACIAQGFLFNFFIRASISWTVALSFQLYSVIKNSKPYFSEAAMHTVFWGIPIFATFIPFAGNFSFGQQSASEGGTYYFVVCAGDAGNRTGEILQGIFEILYTLVAIIILIVLYYKTSRISALPTSRPGNELSSTSGDASSTQSKLKDVVSITSLYTLMMIIFYVPLLLIIVVKSIPQAKHEAANSADKAANILVCIVGLYGVAIAGIFFYSSKDARLRWKTLICEWRIDNTITQIDDLRVSLYNHSSAFIMVNPSMISSSEEHTVQDYDLVPTENFISDNRHGSNQEMHRTYDP